MPIALVVVNLAFTNTIALSLW